MTRATLNSRKGHPSAPLLFVAAILMALILSSTVCILLTLPSSRSPSTSQPRHLLLADPGSLAEPLLGHYGQLMLSFVRPDLPFTLFIPTPSSFEAMLRHSTNSTPDARDLLSVNSSSFDVDNVFALVSRVFGFSAIPRRVLSGTVAVGSEMELDSVSGFRLNLVRLRSKGSLVVNNLVCTAVDIRKGEIVVHLVDGILMDADFELSAMPLHGEVDKKL